MSDPVGTYRDEAIRLLQAGDLDGARRVLQEGISLNPADGRLHGLLGVSYARSGELDAALHALGEAARLMPEDAPTQFNLGNALFQAHRLPEARAALERTLALNPEHPGARQLLERIPASATASPPPAPAAPPAPGEWTPTPPVEASGMHYAPAAPLRPAGEAPGLGRRVLRGWLWGWVYGQWWTAWTMISRVLFSGGRALENPMYLVGEAILWMLIYGFFGSLAGIIIGLIDAEEGVGTGIGIGTGMLLLVGEMVLSRNPFSLINVFFYFVTGRFVGHGITTRVRLPVRP